MTNHPHGRFEQDYDVIELIGKGASSSVYKVINVFDQWIYAIKCVELPDDPSNNRHLLREVTTLSRLQHNHIVRYYNAWAQKLDTDTFSPTEGSFISNGSKCNTSVDHYEIRGDSVYGVNNGEEFTSRDSVEDSVSVDALAIHHGNHHSTHNSSNGVSFSANGKKQNGFRIKEEKDGAANSVLYIQMEFCEKNLRQLINEKLPTPEEFWIYFRHLVDGLNYVHAQGIMHRDLKPSNIFVCESDGVRKLKIGDFGLATDFEDVKSPRGKTRGVGTFFYASPEISGNYDHKTDIWSLGVILFEMCHQFPSEDERHETLHSLRLMGRHGSVNLPSTFPKFRIREGSWVLRLLQPDPSLRPTTLEILSELSAMENELLPDTHALRKSVLNHEVTIRRLLEQLAEKDEKISIQHQQIKSLQEEKNALQSEVMGLVNHSRLLEVQVEKWRSRCRGKDEDQNSTMK